MMTHEKLKAFVPATDLERARRFYCGILDLKHVSEDEFGMELDAGGTPLRISLVGELQPLPFTIAGWVVSDVAVKVVLLGQKGVRFERFPGLEQDHLGIWTAPGGTKVAWFKDPDGNLLSLND